LIQEAFHVAHVSLLLREEGDLVLRAHYGTLTLAIAEAGRFSTNSEPWVRILAGTGTVTEKDLSAAGDEVKLFGGCDSRPESALVSFGQTLGVLTLHGETQDAFRETDLQSLESV